MDFPGSGIVVSLTLILSVPLFIIQFLLCRKNHRLKLLPLAAPALVFVSTFPVDLFVDSTGSIYSRDIFITAVLSLIGNWFLVVLGLAWLSAHLINKLKK